ncbi:MAG: DUF4332 domain-containing protein [Gammaproteobacteria bacterium]
MSYLISQIFWCLLLAFLLGFLLGWFLRHLSCKKHTAELEVRYGREVADLKKRLAEVPAAPELFIPGYPVEDIEGIGAGFGKRLRAEGLDTTDKLLLKLRDAEGRSRVCSVCDIDEKTARSWATMADLLRLPGIGGQWSELLWRCDVHNVQSLGRQQAGALVARMKEVNVDEHRVPELPDEARVGHWIAEAARTPKVLKD